MKTKHLLVAGILCLLAVTQARATGHAATESDLTFVTGQHWTNSSEEQRTAYLYGVGNLLELQQALAENPGSGGDDLVSVMIRSLSPMGLDEVKTALDTWYASNPDQIHRPVLEVLYLKIALPRS